MKSFNYKCMVFLLGDTTEPGHCSECRDKIKQGERAFIVDSVARPKLCRHCVENLVKMAEFREEFQKRLEKSGWFDED